MADYRTDGGQIEYDALVQSKENLEPLDVSQATTEDAYRKRRKEAKEAQLEALLYLAGLGGGAFGTALLVNKNPELAEYIAKLPGANRYSKKHNIARIHSAKSGANAVDLTSHYKEQSFGRSFLSMVSSLEELSPFGILKTLQTSNIIEPMVGFSRAPKDIHLTPSAINASFDYYDKMIYETSNKKGSITDIDLKKGFVLRDNQLLRYAEDGTLDTDNPVLKYAKAVTTHTKMGDSISPNRPLGKFASLFGANLGFNSYSKEQVAVIAGKNWGDLTKKWANATFMQSMEIGYKTLDKPLAGLEDLLRAGGISNTGLFENETYKKIKDFISPQLGTNGNYNLSTTRSLARVSTNIATKVGLGYVGYQAINHLLDVVTPESSAWNDGLLSGLTSNYANTRVGLAKVLADPFQRYKDAQENAADGSTNLTTLLGFPLVGATVGASIPFYKRMFDSATQGIEKASDLADAKIHTYGSFDRVANKFGLTATNLSKSLGFRGAVIGGALTLPFLPGALIGTSSQELKESYSGDKLEANRANSYWLAGGSSWQGEQIKNFQPSRVARILSGAKDEVLYGGDNSVKRDLDPFYSPLKYLRNPYAFEERHTEDMPYPVWGMNVDVGSFLGKAFQGTIGEIIKPTVVNEKFRQDSQALRETSLITYRSVNQIDSDVATASEYAGGKGTLLETARHLMMGTPTSSGETPIVYATRPSERKLIDSGMMLAEETPTSDPLGISMSQSYNALTDFTGLKGFTSSLVVGQLGYDPENVRRQLARSGTSRSLSQDILDENMGDMLGLGEIQRRLIPTSSGSRVEDVNPMLNTAAPSWLPSNEEKYYLDFQRGDYYNKVSLGEDRLPGAGFAKYNKELEGMDPEDYPLVHQYKVLSDVAMGSPEQIALRDYLVDAQKEGKLSQRETDMFYETLTQEQAKSRKKDFSEYKTSEEFTKLSLGGKVLNTIWETTTHNAESPLETLTPWRPGAKFIHKRTAIEDYQKTMIEGPDTGIWTNPVSHFIKPALNRTASLLIPGIKKPEEAVERDNVEEYFDKLEYLKARRLGKTNDALRTVHGGTAAGILDEAAYNKFRSGLSDKQRVYLESFSKEEDNSSRKKILEMLPTDVAAGYKAIWDNLSVAENAKRRGSDVKEALEDNYVRSSIKYLGRSQFKDDTLARDLDTAVSEERQQRAMNGDNRTFTKKDEMLAKAKELRMREADEEAKEYVQARTGIPDNNWVGWDPRLKLDEVKLRTLKIGKADTFDYGFWDSDLQRNARIIALDDEDDVTRSFDDIKRTMRSDLFRKQNIERSLFSNGIFARRVTLSDANNNNLNMRISENE